MFEMDADQDSLVGQVTDHQLKDQRVMGFGKGLFDLTKVFKKAKDLAVKVLKKGAETALKLGVEVVTGGARSMAEVSGKVIESVMLEAGHAKFGSATRMANDTVTGYMKTLPGWGDSVSTVAIGEETVVNAKSNTVDLSATVGTILNQYEQPICVYCSVANALEILKDEKMGSFTADIIDRLDAKEAVGTGSAQCKQNERGCYVWWRPGQLQRCRFEHH